LKKDRDSYTKPEIVLNLWNDTKAQIEKLFEIRSENVWNSDNRNRVNDVLDDVMSLLSLFFMSIGKTRESPAVYAQLVTVKVKRIVASYYLHCIYVPLHYADKLLKQQYLDQLVEMGVYTESLLLPTESRLKDIEGIINADAKRPDISAPIISLIRRKLAKCSK
jgi:hypothetical protein